MQVSALTVWSRNAETGLVRLAGRSVRTDCQSGFTSAPRAPHALQTNRGSGSRDETNRPARQAGNVQK